jgi:hypothetical protein
MHVRELSQHLPDVVQGSSAAALQDTVLAPCYCSCLIRITICAPRAGQFGTRLQGGKDAAGARYIMTRLAPMARTLFHAHDDALLAYLREEGQRIEPQWCAWPWPPCCGAPHPLQALACSVIILGSLGLPSTYCMCAEAALGCCRA